MLVVSLPLCAYVLWGVRDTNYDVETVVHAEDVDKAQLHGEMALPSGHHLQDDSSAPRAEQVDDKKVEDVFTRHV